MICGCGYDVFDSCVDLTGVCDLQDICLQHEGIWLESRAVYGVSAETIHHCQP